MECGCRAGAAAGAVLRGTAPDGGEPHAYVFIAAPRTLWPIRNGGNEALLYVALFCYFAVAGAGSFSLSSRRQSPQASPPSSSPIGIASYALVDQLAIDVASGA